MFLSRSSVLIKLIVYKVYYDIDMKTMNSLRCARSLYKFTRYSTKVAVEVPEILPKSYTYKTTSTSHQLLYEIIEIPPPFCPVCNQYITKLNQSCALKNIFVLCPYGK